MLARRAHATAMCCLIDRWVERGFTQLFVGASWSEIRALAYGEKPRSRLPSTFSSTSSSGQRVP